MPELKTDLAKAMAAAWNAGQPTQVMELASGIVPADIDDEGVLALLGLAQQQTGHHAEAARTFERLCALRPVASAWWNNLGVACRQSGDTAASQRALSRAMALAPDDPEVHYNLGLLHVQQQHWSQARAALLDAVQCAPQFVEARLHAAWACHVCGDNDGEAAMLEAADDWPPQPAEQALMLALMLSGLGRLDSALRGLAQAQLPEGPTQTSAWLRITAQRIAVLERSNQFERAQHELEQLPLAALDDLPAEANEARIEGWCAHASMAARSGRHADAAGFYQRALDLAADPVDRASAAFGLATALDRQGRCDDAWRTLQTAHAAQLEIVRNVEPGLLEPDSVPLPMADQKIDVGSGWASLDAPDARHSPVFVIGFPRSGTTLLEQMLDAHPDFQSMDERGHVYEIIERMQAAGQQYPADLAHLAQADADALRAIYWRLAEHVVPERGQRQLVDKNPLNMLCLPMICRLFPEARIVLCLRHPCDVLLSCYMQSFRSPAFMAMCASLERLVKGYARAFENCCGHLEVFKPRVLEWRYESVVGGLEAEAARLGQFLDVADATPMTRFSEHARDKHFISTPSYAQVTQPVHGHSLGRWENYREQFEPVLPILRPWIERFGYGT